MRMAHLLMGLLLLSVLGVRPALAKNNVIYRANGKLEEYSPGSPAAEVVDGRWSVKVKEGGVDFKAFYREMNLDPDVEQSPEGTIDHFWIYIVEADAVEIADDTCTITGDFKIIKKWWILPEHEDYPPPVKWIRGEEAWRFYDVSITIDSDGIEFHFFGGLKGPTMSINY